MEMHVPAAVLEARHAPVVRSLERRIEFEFAPQLQVHFDRDTRAMWSRWTPEPRPCFNPSLLSTIRTYYDFLAETGGRVSHLGEDHDIEYVVLASGHPGVFNLGGDLDLFKRLIDARDRQGC
jgi:DSF synthase